MRKDEVPQARRDDRHRARAALAAARRGQLTPHRVASTGRAPQKQQIGNAQTTTLVADRLRGVTQAWVSNGQLDPNQASALVDDVLKALRGETPELEQQMGRNLERNRDNLFQDLGVPSQKEMDELRGRIDRLEQQLRQLNRPE